MSSFSLIRPKDDLPAQRSSKWADDIVRRFTGYGHILFADVDDTTPADGAHVAAVLSSFTQLVCYFGHGDENSLLTGGVATVDVKTIKVTSGIAVVAIACKTANNLAPAAITVGANAWLGFTVSILTLAPHKTIDPIGDAIVGGLDILGVSGTMKQTHDNLWSELDQAVNNYDTGGIYNGHPYATLGYYGAMAMRDHLVLHGKHSHTPL